jgi:hypothetical protein
MLVKNKYTDRRLLEFPYLKGRSVLITFAFKNTNRHVQNKYKLLLAVGKYFSMRSRHLRLLH